MTKKTTNQKDYVALLTIPEIPHKKRDQDKIVDWLRNVASEIKKSDPRIYARPCRFRLMK